MARTGAYSTYHSKLVRGFWDFVTTDCDFPKGVLDKQEESKTRPPVLERRYANSNVIVENESSPEAQEVLSYLPVRSRHKWFGSMKSSQALAQSVFGNLMLLGKLNLLENIPGCDGKPIFGAEIRKCTLEYEVGYLGELRGRPTSLDVLLEGEYRVAVECKLTETEFGSCSRPRLKQGEQGYCDGNYGASSGSPACSLTAAGVKYWHYIPELFKWSASDSHIPCPVRDVYQLVRVVLAACVKDGRVDTSMARAVLIYDDRNPEFRDDGKAIRAWRNVRDSMYTPHVLQKCSWQTLVREFSKDESLSWLVDRLNRKYRLT